MHPRGQLDKDVYQRVGETFATIKQLDEWTDGAVAEAEIAIVEPRMTRFPAVDFDRSSMAAATRMLSELKYQFDVVDSSFNIDKYNLLVLPDTVLVDDKLAAKLKAHLGKGGAIISSGQSGLTPDKSRFALEPVSKLPDDDQDAGHVEKRLIDIDLMFISDHQSSEVSNPGDAAFHLPAALVSPQFSSVLRRRLHAVRLVRTNQIDTSPSQAFAQRIRVGRLVVDQSFGIFSWSATSSRHRHFLQCRFDQRRLVRARGGKLNSQRKTLAACHHHPLRTLSAFGLADAGAPFFAGAKLPSAKVSSQSSRPWSSSSPKNLRQMSSQTPWSSQSRRRRQQVLGDGYCLGRSFQRAPERSTQRMPAKHRRSSARRLPPADDRRSGGNSGWILFHCSSVSSESCRDIKRIPFHVTFKHKSLNRANLTTMWF